MASVQTSSYEGRYLKLTVTQTKGTSEQNYSTINWTLESIGGAVNYYSIFNYGVWIDGMQRYDGTSGTKTKNWDSYQFPAAKGSVSGSFIKYHNADGSVGNIGFTLKGCVFYNRADSYDGTLTMESIARYFSSKPTIEVLSRNETQATIKWTTSEKCSEVQYKLDNGSWNTVVSDANATSGQYTINNLTPGRTYTIYGDYKRRDSGLWAQDKPYTPLAMYDYPKPISMNNFIIGNGAYVNLYNPLGRSVTLQILQESTNTVLGTYSGTYNGVVNGEFKTADAISRQYASIPTSKSGTYYCKVTYGSIVKTLNDTNNHTYSIAQSDAEKPLFDSSYIINVVNNSHTEISGTNKFISGHNNLSGTIKPMVPQKSATADYYSVSSSGLATVTKTYSASNQSFTLGNMVSNTFNVTAIDKRGMSRTVGIDIDLIAYNNPGVTMAKITRQNGIGTKAVLHFEGAYTNWSGLLQSNSIQTIKYRVGASGNFLNLPNDATITNTDGRWILDTILTDDFVVTSQYNLYLQITDLLETITVGPYIISTADALVWKDLANKRIGINKKPTCALDVDGYIKQNNNNVLDVSNTTKHLVSNNDINIMLNRRESDALTNVNLNDYRCPGVYGLYGTNINEPELLSTRIHNGYQTLIVEAYSDTHIIQTYKCGGWSNQPVLIYTRGSYGDGTNLIWSNWQKISTTPVNEFGGWYIQRDVHGNIFTASSAKYLVIRTPVVFDTSDMPRIKIEGYAYANGLPFEVNISWYNYQGSIINQGWAGYGPDEVIIGRHQDAAGRFNWIQLRFSARHYFTRFVVTEFFSSVIGNANLSSGSIWYSTASDTSFAGNFSDGYAVVSKKT